MGVILHSTFSIVLYVYICIHIVETSLAGVSSVRASCFLGRELRFNP